MSYTSFIAPRKLGWGFLLAWVFCAFYAGPAVSAVPNREGMGLDMLSRLLVDCAPVTIAVLVLVVLVVLEGRIGSVAHKRWARWGAPVLTALGTLLLSFCSLFDCSSATLYLAGSVLNGLGSGVMWVLWGELYARLPQDEVEAAALLSAIIAAMLVLAASAMSGWVACAFVLSFPLISGALFVLAWSRDGDSAVSSDYLHRAEEDALVQAHDSVRGKPMSAMRAMGRSGWGVFCACLFTCIVGSLSRVMVSGASFQIIVLLSLAFMAVIGFVSLAGPRRLSIAFLYRWMCPVLTFAFAMLIVLDATLGGCIAFGVGLGARFAFCLITQMYFARFAARGQATPTQSYGLGWIFVHLGDLAGVLVMSALAAFVPGASAASIAAICMVLLVVTTMYVLGDKDSFALAWTPDAGKAQASPVEDASSSESGSRIQELARELNLTPRETEVFALLMKGRSVPYIRDELVVSRETVATHVKHIYAKANVHSRQELLDLAN